MARTVKWEKSFPLDEVPRDKRKEARQDLADFILDAILERTKAGERVVRGHPWKRTLSPEYKDAKQGQGGSGIADMRLENEMLQALKSRVSGQKITVSVSGKQGDKAGGHNQHAGDEHPFLPVRRFIPEGDEKFTRDIESGITAIIESFKNGS